MEPQTRAILEIFLDVLIDFVTGLTHLPLSMKNAPKFAIIPLGLLSLIGSPGCGTSSDAARGSNSAGASAVGSAAGAPSTTSAGAPSTSSAGANSAAGSSSSSAGTGSGSGGAATATGGSSASGGSTGGGGAAAGGSGSVGTAGSTGTTTPSSVKFSFFVASMAGLQAVSGSQNGFGGDLRFGETGAGAGLRGADKICSALAERSMPKNAKVWRAFLSVVDGGDGKQVDAIDRVGTGPWYDRLGRLVANTKADLANTRPVGADTAIIKDLPNEDGLPNHQPDPTQPVVDNHDTLTGSDATGKLYKADMKFTCNDWTTSEATTWGSPRVGHSWPRTGPGGGMTGGGMSSGDSWISALDESGCGAGYHITTADDGPPSQSGTTVGDGGGYGGFYCFALTP